MEKTIIAEGSIYKGEGRIVIVPMINHIAGISVDSREVGITDEDSEKSEIGQKLLEAKEICESGVTSQETPKERAEHAVWKLHSKYKTWSSFIRHNMNASFIFYDNGEVEVNIEHRLNDGTYVEQIKKIILLPEAYLEELGKAVIDVFEAAKEYYKVHKA